MIDINKLKEFAFLQRGLAVGGVPYQVLPDGTILIAIHSKTMDAPDTVTLGRADGCDDAKTIACVRPSPCQLKKGETIGSYLGKAVNTLIAVDGLQDNKPRFVDDYDPAKCITLVVNRDAKAGIREEQVLFFQVNDLSAAKSVFDDGDIIFINIKPSGAYAYGYEEPIPDELITEWVAGDDSAKPDASKAFSLPDDRRLLPTVPGATLIKVLREYFRQ